MTAVYTAVAGEQRAISDVPCFGDEQVFARPVMEAKRYKVLSHLFMPDDVTIWIDGNIALKAAPANVVAELLGNADIAVFRHPYRRTVWQEFDTLRDDPRFAIDFLQRQLKAQRQAYRIAGLPVNAPLFECKVIIRRNVPRVARMMESWWAQICRWQWRDQVSFPYVLWQNPDVKLAAIDGNIREHPSFHHVEQWPSAANV